MKKIVSCLSVLLLLVMGGTACAWDFTDHVKVAPNGQGDALIYPVYAAAAGGWESKIWLTNTATDRSVVAKIIFRSMVNTEELLDFLIYLSPTDAWNGLVRVGESGAVEVYSTDDSAMSASGVWASASNPLRVTLKTPTCINPDGLHYNYTDTNALGYIEVIMSAHSTVAGVGDPDGPGQLIPVSLNSPPVPKTALHEAYWGVISGGSVPVANANDNDMVTDGINVLAGHMEIRNLTLNQNSVYPATVLRDYDGTLRGQALTTSQQTNFGETYANNSRGELEAALSKDFLAMPIGSAATVHFLTFPTKLTILGQPSDLDRCGTSRRTLSPYFDQVTGGTDANVMSVSVNNVDYDMRENSAVTTGIFSPAPAGHTLPSEVNYITGFAYSEGWASYDIQSATINFHVQGDGDNTIFEGAYGGVPVIGTVINLGNVNDGYWGNIASWRDGRVWDIRTTPGTGYNYFYYQYSDSANMGIGATLDANGQLIYDSDLPRNTLEDQTRTDGTGAAPVAAHHPVRP